MDNIYIILVLLILSLAFCGGGLYLAYLAYGWGGVLLAIVLGTLITIHDKIG